MLETETQGELIDRLIELRRQREQLKRAGLIHAESHFPVSLTLLVALALLAIGVLAISSMVYHTGPFGSS